jgi:hypothetical protein
MAEHLVAGARLDHWIPRAGVYKKMWKSDGFSQGFRVVQLPYDNVYWRGIYIL